MKTFNQIQEEYRQAYDVDALVTPNDRNNLTLLIRNQMLLDALQEDMDVCSADVSTNLNRIAELQETINKVTAQSLAIERALGIDRKSRKKDNQDDVGSYIDMIKAEAIEFLERQLVYVYCPKCKVMCGRVFPTHEHTEFDVRIQCSQCGKFATAKRKEKDILFDVKDRDWRRKHPIEIILPIAQDTQEIMLSDEE